MLAGFSVSKSGHSADSASIENDAPTNTSPAPELSTDENGRGIEVHEDGNSRGSSASVPENVVRDEKGEKEPQQEIGLHVNRGGGMDKDRSVGDKTVGKLDESIIKKWEQDSVSISRSSSDTGSSGSEANICRGGLAKACGEAVQDGDAGVLCDKCHNWYHTACQGISKLAMKALQKHQVLAWLCTSCRAELKRAKPHQHRPTLSTLASKVHTLDQTLHSHMTNVQQSLKEH